MMNRLSVHSKLICALLLLAQYGFIYCKEAQSFPQERNVNESCSKVELCPSSLKDSVERIMVFSDLVKDIDQRLSRFKEDLRYLKEHQREEMPKGLTNLALRKKTYATSIWHNSDGHHHRHAVDGTVVLDGNRCSYPSAHTDTNDTQPWFAVDLERRYDIYEIILTFRQTYMDLDVSNYKIYISDTLKSTSDRNFEKDILFGEFLGPANSRSTVSFSPKYSLYITGRYVYLAKDGNHLDIVEIEVMGK